MEALAKVVTRLRTVSFAREVKLANKRLHVSPCKLPKLWIFIPDGKYIK